MFDQISCRPIKVLAGILILVFGAGTASAQEPIETVKVLFMDRCAACHGQTAEGDGPVGSLFAKKPANLTQVAARNNGIFLFSEVYQAIDGRRKVRGHGTSDMPVWGDHFMAEALPKTFHPGLNAEEIVQGRILSLVYYLQSIQTS